MDIDLNKEAKFSYLKENVEKERTRFKVEIRKNKRNAFFKSKRGIQVNGPLMILPDLPTCLGIEERLTDMEKILVCKAILLSSKHLAYPVFKYLSGNLNCFKEDFSNLIIGSDLIPTLKNFLHISEIEENLRETTGIISGITHGPHEFIKILWKNDIILELTISSSHSIIDIAGNSIMALSNIMKDKQKYWKYIYDNRFLQNVKLFSTRFQNLNKTFRKTLIVALNTIFIYPEDLFLEDIVLAIEIMKKLNKNGFVWKSLQVFINLVKLKEYSRLLFDYSFIDYFLQSLDYHEKILIYGLNILANIVIDDKTYYQYLSDKNLLDKLITLLHSGDTFEIEKTLWAFDYFIFNNQLYIPYVLSDKIINKISSLLLHPSEKVRFEASILIYDLIVNTPESQIFIYKQNETDSNLLECLQFPDPDFLKHILLSLQFLSTFIQLSENSQFFNLYKLEFHVNPDIKELASSTLNLTIK